MLQVKIHNTENSIKSHDRPETCPICHKHIVAKEVIAVEPKDDTNIAEILFICNNSKCNHMFISKYKKIENKVNENAHELIQVVQELSNYIKPYSIIESYPLSASQVDKKEIIEEMSSSFYRIYQQALDAEVHKLDDIAGGGLRKALEFLVKDYAISCNKKDKDTIQKMPLSQVIKTYMVDAPKVTSCATRAIWLGNDEVHYTRKWEDKDITHLKILIELTLNHIESELLTAKFEADMS